MRVDGYVFLSLISHSRSLITQKRKVVSNCKRVVGRLSDPAGVEPKTPYLVSFRAGVIIANSSEPATIADGARTLSLGQHNWAILQKGLSDVIEVTEEQIKEAVRLLFRPEPP